MSFMTLENEPMNIFPLERQSSVYSLTIDEFQNTMNMSTGKDFGSMNMDEFLKSIWSAEETQELNGSPSNFIQRQWSITLPRTLSQKTVDAVWKDVNKEYDGERSDLAPRQLTLGEVTLEEFLTKAGVVKEEMKTAERARNFDLLGDMNRPISNQSLGFGFHEHMGNQVLERNTQPGLIGNQVLERNTQPGLMGNQVLERNSPPGLIGNRVLERNTQPGLIGNQVLERNTQPGLIRNQVLERNTQPGLIGNQVLERNFQPGFMGKRDFESNNQANNLLLPLNEARHQQHQQIFPKQSNLAYANPIFSKNLVQNGGIGTIGSSAVSSDGFGRTNGDDVSVSPVPYMFTEGVRGRRNNQVVEKVIERRHRRMIKNRESAARSRARKQAYTMELEAELEKLKEDNQELQKKRTKLIEMQINKVLDVANLKHGGKRQSLKRTWTGPY